MISSGGRAARIPRYELVEGFVVAMAPWAPAQGALFVRLGGVVDAALRARPPCTAVGDAGVILPDRDDTFHVADIAVTLHFVQGSA
jgi:hypothetical protein